MTQEKATRVPRKATTRLFSGFPAFFRRHEISIPARLDREVPIWQGRSERGHEPELRSTPAEKGRRAVPRTDRNAAQSTAHHQPDA